MSTHDDITHRKRTPEERLLKEFGWQLAEIRNAGRPQPAIIIVSGNTHVSEQVQNEMHELTTSADDAWLLVDTRSEQYEVVAGDVFNEPVRPAWLSPGQTEPRRARAP